MQETRRRALVKVDGLKKPLLVEFTDENPMTAKQLWRALPITSTVHRWGDEIYFETPLRIAPENAREVVDVGEVAYWCEGKSVCIFFGKTPISTDEHPKAYNPVNVFGKVLEGLTHLRHVKRGKKVVFERYTE